MAKKLTNVGFRDAENGFIVSWHTEDTDADGDTIWDSEEKVFLDTEKTEMKEFVSELIDEMV